MYDVHLNHLFSKMLCTNVRNRSKSTKNIKKRAKFSYIFVKIYSFFSELAKNTIFQWTRLKLTRFLVTSMSYFYMRNLLYFERQENSAEFFSEKLKKASTFVHKFVHLLLLKNPCTNVHSCTNVHVHVHVYISLPYGSNGGVKVCQFWMWNYCLVVVGCRVGGPQWRIMVNNGE